MIIMTMRSLVSDKVNIAVLSQVLDAYGCNLEKLPSKEERNELVYNLENRYYTQIVYKLPEQYIALSIKYYETLERYEMCAKIIKEVEEYVKLNGKAVLTTIEKC